MALSVTQLQKLMPAKDNVGRYVPTKKADIAGLWIYVIGNKDGQVVKTWKFRSQIGGVDKTLVLGKYPELGLQEARLQANMLRKAIAEGKDPFEERKIQKYIEENGVSQDCFKNVAGEWFVKTKSDLSDGQKRRIMASLEKDVFPHIGQISIKDIKPRQIIEIARRIESRLAIETCHRVIGRIREVFDFAIVNEYCENNPAASVSKVLIPVNHGHFPAITEPDKIRDLIRKINSYQGSDVVNALIKFTPLVFQRPGEIRKLTWDSVDFKNHEIKYFVTKTKVYHVVPLNRQAQDILNELHKYTGEGKYIFPSPRNPERPISNSAIRAAYASLGIDTQKEHTEHSWRTSARTILDEQMHFPSQALELQLAHTNQQDRLRGAYARMTYIDIRIQAMAAWGNYLEDLVYSDDDVYEIAKRYSYKA